MNLELFFSVIALIITTIIGFFTWLQNHKSNKLQERIVELEEQREMDRKLKENRAHVRASLEYSKNIIGFNKKATNISLVNDGKIEARNIRMYVNGDPINQFPFMLHEHDHIYGNLKPNASAKWVLSIDEDSPKVIDFMLKWEDDTGKDYSWTDKLTMRI